MRLLLIILLNLLLLSLVNNAYCNGKPGQYFINEEPIWNGDSKLVKHHRYGQLHEIGTGTTTMKLLHVYGTMYQMGLAQGELLQS
jgi:hypothetical protein